MARLACGLYRWSRHQNQEKIYNKLKKDGVIDMNHPNYIIVERASYWDFQKRTWEVALILFHDELKPEWKGESNQHCIYSLVFTMLNNVSGFYRLRYEERMASYLHTSPRV